MLVTEGKTTVVKEAINCGSINNSDESTTVVKEAINSVQAEYGDQTDVTKSMFWEEKTIDSDELDVRHMRRNSASSSVGPSNKVCVPSRYLSVSVGSCHDKCKLGHGHSEMKPPLLRRTLSEGKGLPKKSVARRLSFNVNKADEESELRARKVKHGGGARTVEHNKPPLKVGSAKKPLETATDKVREIQVTTSEEPSMRNVVSTNGRVCRDLSTSSHHRKQEAEAKAKQPEDVSVKTLYMIEPNSLSKPAGTCLNPGLQQKRSEKEEESARVGMKVVSKARQNVSLKSHTSKSLLGSSEKSSKSDKGESGKAELVHVKHIDSKAGTSRAKESKLKKLSQNVEGKANSEPKAMAKRAGKSQVLEEEEDSDSAWRMKFKSGKGIDISSSNNGPMRLKFGRTMSLNDNEHNENNVAKVSYRRREPGGGEEAQDGSAESEKVILRHQKGAVKKNADVNLNKVIKETASKLVKTQKSKVKALVGAFETAMSFNDEASKATGSGTT